VPSPRHDACNIFGLLDGIQLSLGNRWCGQGVRFCLQPLGSTFNQGCQVHRSAISFFRHLYKVLTSLREGDRLVHAILGIFPPT
jgi:hypothetical protein